MDIKEIVENAMSEAESKYPPSDIENALENVLKRAENTAPGEERAAVHGTVVITPKRGTGEHKTIKAFAGIAAVAAVLAGAFFGLKYLSDNNIELLKEGGGNVTVTGTNEPAVTAAQVTTDEDPSTPNVDSFTATSADEWEKEMHRQTFYYPFLAINVIPESMLSLAAPQELAEWELMSVDAEKYPPEHITDYANICTFINHFGISSEDAKKSLGDEWQENVSRLFQEERLDRVVDMICSGDCGKDTEEELCTNVVWYFDGRLICPNWLYVHSLEDWKTAGVKAATINTMYDYYTHNGVLSEEQTAEFKAKLDRYIAENNQRDESEYEYNEDGDVLPIEAPDALPDAETEPTEVSPTDEELKALVEQGAEACGLKITVSDLTKASLKLNYYCEGDNSKYLAFMWGGKYEIQILSGNEWMTYDPDNFRRWNDEQMWFDSSFSINEFPDHSDEHETILFYGDNMYESEIPKGNYRVLKQIAVYGNGKNLGQLTAYAEFTIDEHTPNVFGITMTAKNVSPESVTLAVQQSGAGFHVKRNLGYKAWFVLESKTGSGEWKKVDGNPVTWAPDIEPINENGVTEIKEDFSDIYGSLSDGTYRISKQFVNYVGNGETKDDIINSSTYYCEFVIGEKTHDWGITMSAKDVSPAGMTLLLDQKGGNPTGELTYGEDFSIEIKSDEFGTWEKLGYITDEINWTDIGYILEPGAHNENQINWTYIYGYLPAGHYRLVKEFMDFRKTGDYDQCDFYMEFDVPEIDSKLGITLNTKRNTARWITLDAASIGDTVSEHMSFNENRYVIEQKKNGKWTEYYTTAVPGIPTPETARKINAGDVVTFTVDWRERA
ncbi:MAG: hypothetical protein IK990_01050, partial [Ruminiclostridium sp.]|nr:hypothetical protein [Ruminiclostridium sp.]